MSAWTPLTVDTYPRDRTFLVRSAHVPIGNVNPADRKSYAIAHAGNGTRAGFWCLNNFWPDKPLKDDNGMSSTLWEEWAELPS